MWHAVEGDGWLKTGVGCSGEDGWLKTVVGCSGGGWLAKDRCGMQSGRMAG